MPKGQHCACKKPRAVLFFPSGIISMWRSKSSKIEISYQSQLIKSIFKKSFLSSTEFLQLSSVLGCKSQLLFPSLPGSRLSYEN